MNSRKFCSKLRNWPDWLLPPGAPRRASLGLLILLWWLALAASLSGCQAPIHCQPTARIINLPVLSVTDFVYGLKCQEVLK